MTTKIVHCLVIHVFLWCSYLCDSSCFALARTTCDDDPFHSLADSWFSKVRSYRCRYEIHETSEDGKRRIRYVEASGDERDHTVVVEYDKDGRTMNVLMANPDYFARIQANGAEYKIADLRENLSKIDDPKWNQSRGIDLFSTATALFFLMRSKEIKFLRRTSNQPDILIWEPDGGSANLRELPNDGERISQVFAKISNGDITEVRIATERKIALKTYSKTVKAVFEDWHDFGDTRIPLIVKYFQGEATEPYSEIRVKSHSNIAFNSTFNPQTCFLQHYRLPDPNIKEATIGEARWWFWGVIVIGGWLIFVPIVVRRRWSR